VKKNKRLSEKISEIKLPAQFIFKNSLIGVLMSDLDGRIIDCNDSITVTGGYNRKELLGMKLSELCSDSAERKKMFSELKEEGFVSNFSTGFRLKSGDVVDVSLSISRIKTENKTRFLSVIFNLKETQKLEALNKEIALANRKLRRLAYRDSRTGLFTHRVYDEFVKKEYQRAKRHDRPLSLMMVDVDFFKTINDVYGHDTGDLVLKQLAQKLVSATRSSDVVIRFGGEEFVILLPETSMSKALWLGDRLLRSVVSSNFGKGKQKIKLKISAGLVSYPADDIKRASDMFAAADKCLKLAKLRGGAKICSSRDFDESRPALKTSPHSSQIAEIKDKLSRLSLRMGQALVETIFEFAKGTKGKGKYFIGHSEEVSSLARDIAAGLKLPEAEIEEIAMAAFLCNIGKIGIKSALLSKKGKWSAADMAEYKMHIKYTVEILRMVPAFRSLILLVRAHHERWDGKGYPDGTDGINIPLGARVIAVADAYTALISERPYRKAYSRAKALKIMRAGMKKNFDPFFVEILGKVLARKK